MVSGEYNVTARYGEGLASPLSYTMARTREDGVISLTYAHPKKASDGPQSPASDEDLPRL